MCKNEEILEGFQKATSFLSGMTFTSSSISEMSKIKNINIFSEKKMWNQGGIGGLVKFDKMIEIQFDSQLCSIHSGKIPYHKFN